MKGNGTGGLTGAQAPSCATAAGHTLLSLRLANAAGHTLLRAVPAAQPHELPACLNDELILHLLIYGVPVGPNTMHMHAVLKALCRGGYCARWFVTTGFQSLTLPPRWLCQRQSQPQRQFC